MRPGEAFGLAFPREEYDRRVALVQNAMASRGVEVLLLFAPANTCYVSGFNTVGLLNYQCLIVPVDSGPALVVRQLERVVAESTTGLSRVFSFEDHEQPEAVVRRVLDDMGLRSRRLAAEQTSGALSYQAYRRLEAVLGTEMADGSGIVESASVIKSAIELEYIRTAARISEEGMRAAYAAIAEGRAENDVAAASYHAMVKAGGEFFSLQPVVTSGEKAGIAHTNFHRRLLKRGDAVLLELGGVWNRYAGPLFRTAAVGEASQELRRMHEACVESLEAVLAAMKPGARSGDIQRAAQSVIDGYGYEPNFRKRIGYCFGVGFPPDWGQGYIMDLKHHDDRQLLPGMVFHVAPALREQGRYGAACSETVAVTDQGVEVLTDFPRELFVSG